MTPKEHILEQFGLFSLGTGGIGSWLTTQTDDAIFDRLAKIKAEPLSKVQLDQLLVLAHEADVSDDFFEYYWLSNPTHPYDVAQLPGFQDNWTKAKAILSLDHLKWGLYRLYTDGLLYFGNVRTAFRQLREMNGEQLRSFFGDKRFDTARIKNRGPALPLRHIARDDRYLISEMACKSYGDTPTSAGALKNALREAFSAHTAAGGGRISFKDLLEGRVVKDRYATQQGEFIFSMSGVLDDVIESDADLDDKYERLSATFFAARDAALTNTKYYLSMVNDIDVYVATSMRSRQDFRDMAAACEQIFADKRLADLHIRYFDPTLSAASGHEDKGLIECLMVKCAKVLVYCAGERESFGKDVEAAMALSLGKPVIFYCDRDQKIRLFRDVHPLSRLIDFATGVAVGAMVTDDLTEVSELLSRIFTNDMEYKLEQSRPGYLRLRDKVTDSVVRLQTNDVLLSETFWNHYHNPRRS